VGETTRTLARPCGWTCERESLGLWSREAYGGVGRTEAVFAGHSTSTRGPPLVKTAVIKRSRKNGVKLVANGSEKKERRRSVFMLGTDTTALKPGGCFSWGGSVRVVCVRVDCFGGFA